MKKLATSLLVLFLGLVPTLVSAQLKFSGELRPRTEYRHGLKSLYNDANEAAFFTSQRTRLNVNYSESKFRVGISLQDIRTWGDVKQLNFADNNKIMLHEGWGEILFCDWFSLKLGRQELVYDDHRILGNVGWAQQARSHDLALFKMKAGEKGHFHLGFAYNQDEEKLDTRLYTTGGPKGSNYKSMQFAWYHREFENFQMSLLFLNNGLQYIDAANEDNNETRYSQTFGTHLNYKPGKVKFSGSAYYQTGKDKDDRDLKAYLVSASMYYPVGGNWKGNVGFEIQSGTDSDERNSSYDNRSFTPLFGTNHKFNGHMDYFYVGNHGDDVGLQDYFAGLNYAKDEFSFASTVHVFATQADLMTAQGKEDSYLGTEVDLSFGYKFSKSLVMKVGYSQMFASDSMEVLKGGDSGELNNWGWVMFVFKPNFLNK